jgi:hypothetical protein
MKRYCFYFLFLFSLISCQEKKWDVDISQINFDLQLKRFDLDLWKAAESGINQEELEYLHTTYPETYPLFMERIMELGEAGSPQSLRILNEFISNKDVADLFKELSSQYPQGALKAEVEELQGALRRFHHYFPNRVLPELRTIPSLFSYNVVTDDSLLIICLDTYLGADYEVYPQVGIPKYKFQQYSREYMVSDAMKAWLFTEFDTVGGKTLLEQMVFQGKILYLSEAFLPEVEAHINFNYQKEDLQWCEENEEAIWFHFVDMDLLYTLENHQLRKYLGEAPFIAGFPEGSPGRVGQWVGYRIVEAFMKNNPKTSPQELMHMRDANKILQQSKYKPRR